MAEAFSDLSLILMHLDEPRVSLMCGLRGCSPLPSTDGAPLISIGSIFFKSRNRQNIANRAMVRHSEGMTCISPTNRMQTLGTYRSPNPFPDNLSLAGTGTFKLVDFEVYQVRVFDDVKENSARDE